MYKKIIKKTPLEYNYRLSTLFNSQIYFKREDLQTVRSFKIRGAFNAIHKYVNQTNEISSITTASAGNHAQGVAHSCHTLKIPCDILEKSIALFINLENPLMNV
jgi:threonine dehydratase